MATTISGHPALVSFDLRLRTRQVPGRPIRLRAHYAALPLMLRLAVLLDQVLPLHTDDTSSYCYRRPRTSPTTGSYSDHAGWAMDLWTTRIGREGFPTHMTHAQAQDISTTLKKFVAGDGSHVFGWGASDKNPGVDYPITYSRLSDPMHIHVAPGITVNDLKNVKARMRINTDGTIG